ncbi:MAG: HU family DNA-binding protein [Brevundimonas sp.]|jgi:DNA-binding protein HU-beta|uniref:HU family DNA-binding protein n=1 Tax=Brevundimonas sp. TaxID=1871086 RepID=UPI003001D6DE
MSRPELVGRIARAADLTPAQARAALDAVLDGITEGLAEGRTVRLTGFGAFIPADRPEREGRHPASGERLVHPAARTVRFRPGEGLKSALNG